MFLLNPQRNPRMCQHAREQVLLCSRSSSLRTAPPRSGGCCPGPPLEEHQLTGSWELDGGAEGWRRVRQQTQPADLASKGKKKPPLLVCIPVASRRVLLLCLSCHLCLSFTHLSWGRWKCDQHPGRARAPPDSPQAGWKHTSVGQKQQHFQGEQECAPQGAALHFLPHSFFMKTASRWEWGSQRHPLRWGVLCPPCS